jgi:hypothetical protein
LPRHGFFFENFKDSIGRHPYIAYAFHTYVNDIKEARALKNAHAKWTVWGWYIVLDSIAEGDRFGRPDLTKMEGALLSNFYEAMIWVGKQRHLQSDETKGT